MEHDGRGAEGAEANSAEEEGTGRAPTDAERVLSTRRASTDAEWVLRRGFVGLAEYNWPLAIHGGAHEEPARIAIERWDRSTRTEQDRRADEIADELESFFGLWPILREVLDIQAERGEARRPGGGERHSESLTLELQALPGGT